MFTIEELFSKTNIKNAFKHFDNKGETKGPDKMKMSELREYWSFNSNSIIKTINESKYNVGTINIRQILNNKGKKREIASYNVIDRFISRLLSQKLKSYLERDFENNSCAYQEGKGVEFAIKKVQEYLENGDKYVIDIDLEDYFNNISIELLLNELKRIIEDNRVIELIKTFLYCKVNIDGSIIEKRKGLIQGNSISPVLSNLYLDTFDKYLNSINYNWIRFADNICIYTKTLEEASIALDKATTFLSKELLLPINQKKSGVFNPYERRLLGYNFIKGKDYIEVRKHNYQKTSLYHNWHESSLKKINDEYYIIQNGILNKQDYSILFENKEEKHKLPVKAINQINIYNDVVISKDVIKLLSDNNIRLSIFDKFGYLIGSFYPEKYSKTSIVFLKQCEVFINNESRLKMAKIMENVALYNIRSNLRYYYKNNKRFKSYITFINKCIKDMNEAKTIEKCLLVEARARYKYYESFNLIIKEKDFEFKQRTKQPPKDELNALISFGNTLLYSFFLKAISKSSLSSRIGVIHSTNKRSNSLNLDFADMYKPIIVDRVIFSCINKRQIRKEHFINVDNDGVYLSDDGKRIFIKEFEDKLYTQIEYKGFKTTYKQALEKDVFNYQASLNKNIKYHPFKYY